MMMSRRVRFLRSSSSRLEGGPAPPPAGTAMVRPVVAAIIVVAPAAAATPMTEVRLGSPASTGRPSAKRRRSARSSSAEA